MSELMPQLFEKYLDDPKLLEQELFEDVCVSEETVNEDKRKQAYTFTKWKFLLAIANAKLRIQESHIKETVWPSCCIRAREILGSQGRKDTAPAVEEIAYLDPAFKSASEVREAHKFISEKIESVVDGLYHRMKMLESMSYRGTQEKGVNFASTKESPDSKPRDTRSIDELEAGIEHIFERGKKKHGS